jgi:hypothetical protein
MPLLNYLQFQPIDDMTSDDIPDNHRAIDEIDLDDQVDEQSLESFWNEVSSDLHSGDSITYSDN